MKRQRLPPIVHCNEQTRAILCEFKQVAVTDALEVAIRCVSDDVPIEVVVLLKSEDELELLIGMLRRQAKETWPKRG